MKLISVIIPIFNVEAYLRECIISVINQTYSNLEIILVNDGSPDNCGAICDAYAKQDARITVIHKENGGLSDARNAGLDICTGDYIAFVDSDDVVHPRFIEVLYANLLEANADISFCDFEKFTETKNIHFSNSHQSKKINLDGLKMIDNLYDTNWMPKNVVVWNKLYKREIFSNLRFPKGLVHEDEYIFIDLYKNNPKVVYTSEKLYFYRVRDNSIMADFSYLRISSYLKALDNRMYFFNKINHPKLNILTMERFKDNIVILILNGGSYITNKISFFQLFKHVLTSNLYWKSKLLFFVKYLKGCFQL